MAFSGEIHPVDTWVGRRIRTRRRFLGLSQIALANSVGLSYQQIQKYEKGDNRVSASALAIIADTLDKPIAYFFEGSPGARRAAGQPGAVDPLSKSDVIRMAREFDRIANVRLRRRLIELARAVAERQEDV